MRPTLTCAVYMLRVGVPVCAAMHCLTEEVSAVRTLE